MAKAPKLKGIIVNRPRRKMVKLPAATLGYHNLIEPDVYTPPGGAEVKKYKANFHYDATSMVKLKAILADAVEPAWQGYVEECEKKDWTPTVESASDIDIEDFLEDRIREVTSDKARVREPFINVSRPYKKLKDKNTGKEFVIEPKAWDNEGTLLDLRKLNPWSGTKCIPIVEVGLFSNGANPDPTPTLRLVGIQVLKLESGGAGDNIGAVTEDDAIDLAGDEDIDFEDLSGFAAVGLGSDDDVGLTDEDNPL